MIMAAPTVPVPLPGRIAAGDEAYQRAVDSHDPRFDGVFYVAITTTRIYCRPVCPSRNAAHDHRRFFDSAAAAERAGFRPCLRCRPELAPQGLRWSLQDASATLAQQAARLLDEPEAWGGDAPSVEGEGARRRWAS